MRKRSYWLLNITLFVLLVASAFALSFNLSGNYGISNDYGTVTVLADEPKTELPSAVNLVGSPYLPPIDNQYQVGCCASESGTYMQFTNAVARYVAANYPDIAWGTPSSGNNQYVFSPKFTYTLGGSFAYDILKDHGCLTLDKSSFYKIDDGNYYYANGELKPSAISWDIVGDNGFDALQFRLKNYEKVYLLEAPYMDPVMPKINDNANIMFTTSDAGRELLYKIKDSLNQGNVVTASGFPYRWVYEPVTNGGIYGTAGESIIVAAAENHDGNHMVSIVGYDDTITATYKGVTLQGAFLIANSWGTHWKNNGYVWMMYDALNTVSEHPELANYPENRNWAFYEFNFTYWDKDVAVLERPELILKTDITVTNREAPYIVLTMHDKESGNTVEHVPAVFYYGLDSVQHPIYESYKYDGEHYFDWDDDNEHWLTFGGIENGTEETGTFYFSYQALIDAIPEGKTLHDYTFGAKFAASRGATVKYSNISLINGDKVVLQSKIDEITCISTDIQDKVYGGSVAFSKINNIFTVNANNGEGYFFNYKSNSVIYGENFEFTLSTVLGYDDSDAVVTVNGVPVFPKNGKYTVENVTADINIEVSGIVKIIQNKSTVNFYVDGVIYASDSYLLGEEIVLPSEPQKQGYTFVGWIADAYEQSFSCMDTIFPQTMPGFSFNAYAEFEPVMNTVQLSGDKYGEGITNSDGSTVLWFTINYGENPEICNDLWNNRQQYEWTLHYSWKESRKAYSFEQNGIVPFNLYHFDVSVHEKLFCFKICDTDTPFVPKKDQVYKISLTIKTENIIYEVSGNADGYRINEEPICYNKNAQAATVSHCLSSNNDFEYRTSDGKTYMTLRFSGIDASVYYGNYLWKLHVINRLEDHFEYSCYPNSFTIFSESDGKVRFPVLEMGWLPEYDDLYSVDFEVYNGNVLLYTASLSDVRCNLEYQIEWNVNERITYTNCRIGETPEYGNVSYETETEKYEHISWNVPIKPATVPCTYVSLGNYVAYDYLVTFMLGDDSTISKGVVAGTPVERPANPEKTGYCFAGWYDSNNVEYDFNTPVNVGLTLYAVYNPNSYTVAFETNGGSAIANKSVTYNDTVVCPAAPEKTGYTFNGWYSNYALTIPYNFNTGVTEDITLYAKYTINVYTVTFATNGGSAISTQEVTYGETVAKPDNPTKEHHSFSGWYKNQQYSAPYDFDAKVTGNITLYAKFVMNDYYVTFMLNGDAEIYYQIVSYGDLAEKPVNPEKIGHTFNGWFTEPSFDHEYKFTVPITKNIYLYAKFTPNVYTVTFATNGGSAIGAQEVSYEHKATKPADPEKTGFLFDAWYADAELQVPYDFANAVITYNTVIFAKYNKNIYTVAFETNGGSAIANKSVTYNDTVVCPAAPEKTGYTFNGWYSNYALTIPYNFNTGVTEDITLYAKYTINVYTVTFATNGGSAINAQAINYENKVTKPADPEKAGFLFDAWYADAELQVPYDFANAVITYNTVIFAKYNKNIYTVTFETNGAVTIDAQAVEYYGTAEKPADPEKEGYTFDGWFTTEGYDEEFYFVAPITTNLTLYAKFTKIIVMEFDSFVWDGYTAQAKYVCKDDETIVEYYNAKVTNAITKEASIEESGIRTYTAAYDGHTATKEETIPMITSQGCAGEINGSAVAIYSVLALCCAAFLLKLKRKTK